MTSLPFESAVHLAKAIRRKEVSSLELTDLYIERIERYDAALNAVVVRRFDAARDAARAADLALARGESLGPLHGLPVTIKEAYDLEGTPTTWGIPAFRDNVATSDAEIVRRTKAAGAHFMGKNNVAFSLGDFQSFNPIYGTTNNPWNLGRTPGGSSGGSAAALAAGFTALDFGSDIGGSIRNPAHFCGVYGHKPTWGVVSDSGHALPGMVSPVDLGVVGPMARSAEDLALAMDVVAGPDALNSRGWELRLRRPDKSNLGEFRVALWLNDDVAPISAEVADRAQSVADSLAKCGATLSDRARPPFAGYGLTLEDVLETYHGLLWGMLSAGVPDALYAATKAQVATLAEHDRSVRASSIRYSAQDHRAWMSHHNRRVLIRRAWAAFFEDWDILICPVAPTAAFSHDHGPYFDRTLTFDGHRIDYMDQLNWAGLITVAHLPSSVFPTGPSGEGLPIGLQAVGGEFDDYVTIDFCRLLANEIGGFIVPPGFAQA